MSEEIMAEDPLKFLLDLSGYTLVKDKRNHQLISLALFLVEYVLVFVGIMEGFLSGDELKPFILGFIFHLSSDFAFMTSIIYGHDVNKYKDMMFENCCSFESGGPKIENEIMDEIKIVKVYCIIPLILSTITTLSFLPFVGDEEVFSFQWILINEWLKDDILRFLVNIISVPYLCISGWIVGNTVLVTGYIVFHLRFQVKLLDRHFRRLEDSISEENEEKRQKKIQENLSSFVKNHQKIKKWRMELVSRPIQNTWLMMKKKYTEMSSRTMLCKKREVYRTCRIQVIILFYQLKLSLQKKVLRRQNFYMIMLTPPAILTVVVFVYFIKTEVSPPSNFRMYLGLTTGVVTFILHCIHGQLLYNESSKLHEKLYSCSWPDWNISNKKQLLIILPEIEKPMKVTCFGLIDLDHPYIVFVGRAVYSLLTLAMRLYTSFSRETSSC